MILAWRFWGLAIVTDSLWHAGKEARRGLQGPCSSPLSTLPESCLLSHVCPFCMSGVSRLYNNEIPDTHLFHCKGPLFTIHPILFPERLFLLNKHNWETLISLCSGYRKEAHYLGGKLVFGGQFYPNSRDDPSNNSDCTKYNHLLGVHSACIV